MAAEVSADNWMHRKLNIYVQPNSSVKLYPLQHHSNFPTGSCNVISQVENMQVGNLIPVENYTLQVVWLLFIVSFNFHKSLVEYML